jgi:prepilin-type N-terminal cleavage/methylation domain-containing protein
MVRAANEGGRLRRFRFMRRTEVALGASTMQAMRLVNARVVRNGVRPSCRSAVPVGESSRTPLKWPGIRRGSVLCRKMDAFTLVELVCTMMILASLAAVAAPRFVSMTGAAYHAQVAWTAGAFDSAIRLANLVCFVRSWANRDNLPGYGAGTIDFNTACYPTDTSGNANAIANNANRCVRVWNGVLDTSPTITNAASGADYRATAANNVCTYRYLVDSATTRRFTYNSLSGDVAILNP